MGISGTREVVRLAALRLEEKGRLCVFVGRSSRKEWKKKKKETKMKMQKKSLHYSSLSLKLIFLWLLGHLLVACFLGLP